MIVVFHELLEGMKEARINDMIENQRKKDLGGMDFSPSKPTLWIVLVALSAGIYMALRRGMI
jgi:hypothetical protein